MGPTNLQLLTRLILCSPLALSDLSDIARETNRARWYEYALSSSVMICAIAIIFGCYDLGTLILMFIVNAVMNLFGLLMERMNPPERTAVDWAPFIFGCIAGAAPWIVVRIP